MFFGYSYCYSLMQASLELGLPSFDTVIINSRSTFQNSRSSYVTFFSVSFYCYMLYVTVFFFHVGHVA